MFGSATSNPDRTSALSIRIAATSFISSTVSGSCSASSAGRFSTRRSRPSINGDFGLISSVFSVLAHSACGLLFFCVCASVRPSRQSDLDVRTLGRTHEALHVRGHALLVCHDGAWARNETLRNFDCSDASAFRAA